MNKDYLIYMNKDYIININIKIIRYNVIKYILIAEITDLRSQIDDQTIRIKKIK
jgi:hypothetical protein